MTAIDRALAAYRDAVRDTVAAEIYPSRFAPETIHKFRASEVSALAFLKSEIAAQTLTAKVRGTTGPKVGNKGDYRWTVVYAVDPTWVADGFDLDDERALAMLEGDLTWATEGELAAKVIHAPNADRIRKEQGYTS